MSGYKRATITISRDEYDRLREASHSLRALPEISAGEREAISQQSIDALRQGMETVLNRQNVFHHIVTGFDQDLRAYEERSARRIHEAQEVGFRQAQQAIGSLWENVTTLVAEQERRFQQQHAASREEMRAALNLVAHEIQEIAGDARRKQAVAGQWLASAEAMRGFLQQYYACEFFAPGQMDPITRALQQAAGNLAAGMPEAALTIAQEQYFTLSDLHRQLEAQHSEWQMLAAATWETASQFLAAIEASEYVEAVDLDGNRLPYEILLAHWSDGALEELIEKAFAFLEGFASGSPSYTIASLREWHDHHLPEMFRALEAVVEDARIRAMNAQLRINIADLVVQALGEQGFQLQAASYAEGDARQSYLARLTADDGCEVMVKVEPTGDQIGENELHLHALDQAERTEHELQQRWKEISRSLAGYGLGVGQVTRESAPPSYRRGARRQGRDRARSAAQQQAGGAPTEQAYGD